MRSQEKVKKQSKQRYFGLLKIVPKIRYKIIKGTKVSLIYFTHKKALN